MALIVFGGWFAVCGAFIVWSATAGRDWNSTHNRFFQRTPRVDKPQERLNTTVGLFFGPPLFIGGVLAILFGVAGLK